MRKLLNRGQDRLAGWFGLSWLTSVSTEAVKSARAILFWSTIALMIGSAASMLIYHLTGRDTRADFQHLAGQITAGHLLALGVAVGKIVGLAIGVAVAYRLVRRARVVLEIYVHHHLPKHVDDVASVAYASGMSEGERRAHLEETIRRWFALLERFAMALVVIGALWLTGRAVGFASADGWATLVLHIVSFFMVARLLTLACRTIFHVAANIGNKHLDKGHFHRYWERVVRLFPFGEKCFEAAVWIFAASECAKALEFIAFIAAYGQAIVQCIGIFFGTRVIIELLHVFINQSLGMYKEERTEDQRLTLVPLLESVSRYVVYFGSALMMLHVFGLPTYHIVASAGVVGLAVGLGAQSFVADVVSGFFILFEEQYFVGDVVQIGDAVGRVEAINIRHTQIRDEFGKLYIIPNGQIKTVVNFSKGFVNAVVDIRVPTSANLDQVMRDMAEAGKRLKDRRREVLADTAVKGLVDLTPTDMAIRAVTKVHPGTHLTMQQEYRKILKEVFDESARTSLKIAA